VRTSTSACLRLPGERPGGTAGARAWRPCPVRVADILCVDEARGHIGPRIQTRFALTVMPAPAVIRVESSRCVVADRNWILLVPPWQLHAARVEDHTPGAVTLLLGASQLEGLAMPDRPALVPEGELGEELASLVEQWRHPLRPLDSVLATRPLVRRLLARAMPLGPAGAPRATPLLPIRDYLHTQPGGPVPIAALAAMSGLTECHLIRAFHMTFGLPPHAYHLRVRLASAADLLAGGLALSATAYECGFVDQSHLSRKFKEAYGLTPAAWAIAAADAGRQRAPIDEGSATPRSSTSAARAAGEGRSRAWVPANCG
jgi:AraC-like DNA-binding protein